MRYRTFGRTDWQVSEIGYGMWGMGGWSGLDDDESLRALNRAVELGCNFFDTAYAYGDGRSEKLLGQLVRAHPDKKLYTATKIPPKNRKWPAEPHFRIEDVFPPDYIREYTEKSLKNLGLDSVDLIQFHVWDDTWADDERWQEAVADLKREGLIRAFGISVDRWQPDNVIRELRTGLIDAVDWGQGSGQVFEIPVEALPVAKVDDFSLHQIPTSNMLRELQDQCGVRVTVVACDVGLVPQEIAPGLSPEVGQAVAVASRQIAERFSLPPAL